MKGNAIQKRLCLQYYFYCIHLYICRTLYFLRNTLFRAYLSQRILKMYYLSTTNIKIGLYLNAKISQKKRLSNLLYLILYKLLIAFVLLIMFLGPVNGDCGCGPRCVKYTKDLQCTRCCTATVRRSLPINSHLSENVINNTGIFY